MTFRDYFIFFRSRLKEFSIKFSPLVGRFHYSFSNPETKEVCWFILISNSGKAFSQDEKKYYKNLLQVSQDCQLLQCNPRFFLPKYYLIFFYFFSGSGDFCYFIKDCSFAFYFTRSNWILNKKYRKRICNLRFDDSRFDLFI